MNKEIEIICEIGKNFCTTKEEQPISVLLENAKKLIREAKNAGADVAKWQVHNYLDEIHPEAHITSPHFDQDRYEWVKRNTYPFSFWLILKAYCEAIGIEFLATPMSRGAAVLLEELGVKRWKIGSGDICDFVLLDYIRQTGKPVILSSGMSSLEELRKAYNYLKEKVDDITIMHCVSIYPCPLEKLNLLTIPFLKKEFPEAKIGFSDHSQGVVGSLMAKFLGAEVIEKHFTLNKNAWGSDHNISLEPLDFKFLCEDLKKKYTLEEKKEMETIIKNTKSLGVETKFINEEEMKFRKVFHKGLFAGRDIKKGEPIAREDIIALRPRGDAPKSEEYEFYLDKTATKDIPKYGIIEL